MNYALCVLPAATTTHNERKSINASQVFFKGTYFLKHRPLKNHEKLSNFREGLEKQTGTPLRYGNRFSKENRER